MRRSLLFLLLSALTLVASAQTKIGDARNQSVGSVVTVSGIVTNGDELGTIRYMQDETGGIGVYDYQLSDVNPGDSITVTGALDDYRNLLEINPVSSFIVHKSGLDLPDPIELTIDQIGEDYEGQLITVHHISMVDGGGTFAGNRNYGFTDGGLTGELRVNSASPIVGQPIPTEEFSLVAICSQFSTVLNDTRSGYQLLPRTMDDFITESPINFLTPVKVISLSQNSVLLGWETDSGGTPFVRYGSSVNTLTNIKQGDSTTSDEHNYHIAEITGLNPSEVVYAQPFMVLGNDTVSGTVGIYITESNSTGKVNVFFNTAVDETLAAETTANYIGSYMEDTLAAYINRAEQAIDLSIYNFDNNTVKNALNAAKQRGVQIRVITCESTTHASIYDLSDEIPVLERPEIQGEQSGIMHNKFAVIDANHANADKAWVWSGSTNLTPGQLYSDANNMIFIQDQSLAKTYKMEFEEMWGSNTDQPNALKALFGEDKSDNTPHEFVIGGNRVECYFSPSDHTNQKIIDAMGTADFNLYVETMLITRSDLAGSITDAYQRGVKVHVLNDEENSNVDYVNDALTNTLPAGKFVFDDTAPGLLHHKLAIIDVNNPSSDAQVITGSHNWSNSADERNDENTLIIHDPDVANQYLQQFAYRFEQNKGDFLLSTPVFENPELEVYPNPSAGKITVSSDRVIKNVQLFDLNGSLIQQWQGNTQKRLTLSLPSTLYGVFLFRVEQDNGSVGIHKIVKY